MKITIFTACLIIILGCNLFSQDTINFKLFDSLKTSAEDKHKIPTINDSATKKNRIDELNSHGLIACGIDTNSFKKNMDIKLFRSINNNRSHFKDKFFGLFDRSIVPMSVLFPASLFTYSRIEENTYDENSAYLLGISEFTNFVLTFGTKIIVDKKRPVATLHNVYTKNKKVGRDRFSFPSGHTSASMTIATMFALRYPEYPQIYAPMFAWSVLVAYGRPYFGMHYPSDLLGGALIGAGSAVLTYSLRKPLLKFKNNVFKEDNPDLGSMKSAVIYSFIGSFIAGSIFNTFILKDNRKVYLNVTPMVGSSTDFGMNFNLRF